MLKLKKSFNSLQTGKCIQSQITVAMAATSAEFQFPSNGKVYPKLVGNLKPVQMIPVVFQFPSNGKVYPKKKDEFRIPRRADHVSIPFKRESVSKDIGRSDAFGRQMRVSIPFKRESVSKVGFVLMIGCGKSETVSIPFKRESVSKGESYDTIEECNRVSIPFKRESVSKVPKTLTTLTRPPKPFQFPSNGKVYPKTPLFFNRDKM